MLDRTAKPEPLPQLAPQPAVSQAVAAVPDEGHEGPLQLLSLPAAAPVRPCTTAKLLPLHTPQARGWVAQMEPCQRAATLML